MEKNQHMIVLSLFLEEQRQFKKYFAQPETYRNSGGDGNAK